MSEHTYEHRHCRIERNLATLSTLLGHLAATAGAGEAAPPWAVLAGRRRSNRSGSDPRDQTATA